MHVILANNQVTVFFTNGDFISKSNLTEEVLDQIKTAAVLQNEDTIKQLLGVVERSTIPKGFTLDGDSLFMDGIPVSIPEQLAERFMQTPNDEGLRNFWRLAALNPDPAARDNLFWFVDHYDFHITPSGFFVAYRNVVPTEHPSIYTDAHSRSTQIIIGQPVSIPREECDSNQNASCSRGLHVAGRQWLTEHQFGNTGVICLVNPMHVVAVPPVDNYGKMRVCEYMPVEYVQWGSDGHPVAPADTTVFENQYTKAAIRDINELLASSDIKDGERKVAEGSIALTPTQVEAIIEEGAKYVTRRVVNIYGEEDEDSWG